jgi:RTX calcium-binding nonapeptide repeat (4 copies)
MSKLARTLWAAVLAVTALMAAPSGAGAATTIGSTFLVGAPEGKCGPNFTWLQREYTAPSDGVITRWNFQAPVAAADVPQLKFKVARPAGGNVFTMIGESAVVTPVANTLNSYFVQIPVQAGDILGTYTMTTGFCDRAQAGFNEFRLAGDVVPPTMATFLGPGSFQLNVSALLEPDCDKDGFGDETQDTNLSTCAATGPAAGGATCKGKPATIVGTSGSDVRAGSGGPDVIVGLGGNDSLSGVAGNDLICGGAGKDTLKGGKGKDTLLGQKGKDTLKGGGGKDKCIGGKGNDTASKCEVEKSI